MGDVGFCTTSDGVRIAYMVDGAGPPLVIVPAFIESFSLEHLVPEQQDFMRQLGEGRQLVRYDMRGTGLSQREVGDMSLEGLVCDLDAVVRASGLRRLCLWAGTTSGPRAIAYAAHHPRNVEGLILYGTYSRVLDTFPREALQGLAELARADWQLASQTFADMSTRRGFAEGALRIADMYRQSTTGESVARLLLENMATDVTHLLPMVKVPTLVLHRLHDTLFPVALGQQIAAGIRRARFVPLQGSVTFVAFGDSQSVLDAVNAFMGEDAELPAAKRAAGVLSASTVRTVLFTDVEGSTALTKRLGDAKAREVLREHERIVREALRFHGGTEVKTMGDGFMASFSSATTALECAIAIQRAFAEHNESAEEQIRVRIGLNAGEPIAEDEDLFGTAVILAARIAAQAKGGEILASNVVRELVAGKGFLFSDRGDVVLRGFEDPVRLYDVHWREEG